MRTIGRLAWLAALFAACLACHVGAPSALAQQTMRGQIFAPNGKSWSHEVRFMIISSDGSFQQYYFTDSKGSFIIPGLRRGRDYTLVVDGDGETYDTTQLSFNVEQVQYLSVFLNPRSRPAKTRAGKTVSVGGLNPELPSDARRSYDDAVSKVREGKLEQSVPYFEKAIDKAPDYYEAVNDLGVVYLKLQRLPEAEKMFKRATELRPGEFRPLLNLGIALFRSDRYQEAVNALTRCLQIQSGLPEAERYLGESLLELGRLDEAEQHLGFVVATKDDNRPYAVIKLAIVKVQKNDNAAAIRLLEQYLADYPKAGNRPEIERILKQLRP